ncbi:hypothetical protein C8R45DRAFT_928531 [Mycena sanguinolenta]|nr:hypothetical protein C8R45DRAFT_928531 [Mycena sanguinolenta]
MPPFRIQRVMHGSCIWHMKAYPAARATCHRIPWPPRLLASFADKAPAAIQQHLHMSSCEVPPSSLPASVGEAQDDLNVICFTNSYGFKVRKVKKRKEAVQNFHQKLPKFVENF